jgi:hypothetical protein
MEKIRENFRWLTVIPCRDTGSPHSIQFVIPGLTRNLPNPDQMEKMIEERNSSQTVIIFPFDISVFFVILKA